MNRFECLNLVRTASGHLVPSVDHSVASEASTLRMNNVVQRHHLFRPLALAREVNMSVDTDGATMDSRGT